MVILFFKSLMVDQTEKIRTVIVDDNKDFTFILKELLSFFPEINLIGESNTYEKAKKLLVRERPELVFLDVEMPHKSGFELLREVRQEGGSFTVIFCTAYDKYVLRALQESALDYIQKPVTHGELKAAIERYKEKQRKELPNVRLSYSQPYPVPPEMAALPTGRGIRFVDKNAIIAFQCIREADKTKPGWNVFLSDFGQFKLRAGITAREICGIMEPGTFVVINQSAIVNLSYVAAIEFKTRDCILIPPYEELKFTVSRSQLADLRAKFDHM